MNDAAFAKNFPEIRELIHYVTKQEIQDAEAVLQFGANRGANHCCRTPGGNVRLPQVSK